MSRSSAIGIALLVALVVPGAGALAQPVDTATRLRQLGVTGWRANPAGGAGALILLPANWEARNIVKIQVPQLVGKPMFSPTSQTICRGSVRCHRGIADKVLAVFDAWEQAGLDGKICTYDGCFNARLKRGGTTPSNHAGGLAFDINCWVNGLGRQPAARDQRGSVLDLVPIAEHLGWTWGGRWERKDGMHFEWNGPVN